MFIMSPAILNGGERGGGAYHITAVRKYIGTYVPSVSPVRDTNGFRAIFFEKIGILDWNFIHRYIIIKCRSSSI